VFVLLVLVVLLCRRPILRWTVLPKLIEEAETTLGLDVEIDDIDVSILGTVTIEGLRADEPFGETGLERLSAREVTIDLDIGAALRGDDGAVRSVEIEGAFARLELDAPNLIPPTPDEEGSTTLPYVILNRGHFEVALGDDEIELDDVIVILDGEDRRLIVDVPSAGGTWSLPRLDRIEFPLSIDATLSEGDSPFEVLTLDHVRSAGELLARDFVLDFRDDIVTRLRGDVPGFGIERLSVDIGEEAVDLEGRLWSAPVADVVSLFVDVPEMPLFDFDGWLRLRLPFDDMANFDAEVDARLRRLRWSSQQLYAQEVDLRARRVEGTIDADVRLAGVRSGQLANVAPLDLAGRVRLSGGEGFVDRIGVSEAFVELDSGRVGIEGALGLSGAETPTIDGARVFVDGDGLRLSELLARFAPAGTELPFTDGRIRFDASISGPISASDLESELDAHVILEEPGGEEVRIATRLDLASCGLDVVRARVERADDRIDLSMRVSDLTQPTIELRQLEGLVGGERVGLVGRPTFQFDEDRFAVEDLEIEAFGGSFHVLARGRTGDVGSLDELAVTFEDLDGGAALVEVLRKRELVDPDRFDASLAISASLRGRLRWDERGLRDQELVTAVRVDARELVIDDVALDDGAIVELDATMDDESLRVDRLLVDLGADRLEASGEVEIEWDGLPLPTEDAVVVAEARAFVRDIASVPGLEIDPAKRGLVIEGATELHATIGGSWGAPVVDARATLSGGEFKFSAEVPRMREVEAQIAWLDDRLRIERLEGRVDRRLFRIGGHVDLQPVERWGEPAVSPIDRVELTLRADDVLLVRQPDLRVRGDLDLSWRGPWDSSTIGGEIRIGRSYYRRDVELSLGRANLPIELFRFEDPPLRDLQFDVRLRSDRGFSLVNNIVRSRASVNLHLGSTGRDPLLTGTVSTDEGDVSLAASKLELSSAIVEFTEKDPYNPTLQMLFEEQVKDYRIRVTVSGTLSDPQVVLDSSPPLPSETLLVLITTGYTVDEIGTQGTGRVAAVRLATYFGRRLAGYFSRGDSSGRGVLSDLSLESETARRSYLEDLYRLEYRLKRDAVVTGDEVFLQTERDSYGQYNFNLGIRFSVR